LRSSSALEPRLVGALAARYQHRLGVGGAQQPPASGGADTHAVDVDELGASLLRPRLDLLEILELALIRAVEAQLGVFTSWGSLSRIVARLLLGVGDDVEQPQPQ